jgi:hypothetical protein
MTKIILRFGIFLLVMLCIKCLLIKYSLRFIILVVLTFFRYNYFAMHLDIYLCLDT